MFRRIIPVVGLALSLWIGVLVLKQGLSPSPPPLVVAVFLNLFVCGACRFAPEFNRADPDAA